MNKEPTQAPAVMTRAQVAEYLQMCLTCVDRSDIPRVKIARLVRFRKSDVDAWLEAKAAQGAAAVGSAAALPMLALFRMDARCRRRWQWEHRLLFFGAEYGDGAVGGKPAANGCGFACKRF